MDRRSFVKVFLTSTGASLLSGHSLGLFAADPKKIAALQESKLWPAIRVCNQSIDLFDKIEDYEAVFVKKELFGDKLIESAMQMKIRENPFSVYLLFVKPHEGREVIYVEGQNAGEMLVHESGIKSIVGTLSVNPAGDRAMEENHHPITDIGMKKMILKLLDQWETNAPLPNVEVKYYPKATIGDVACKVVEVKNPEQIKGAAFHLTRLYLHDETNLPIRVQQYDFPKKKGAEPQLHEEYTYLNIKTNQGLKDIDFDVKNPNYNY